MSVIRERRELPSVVADARSIGHDAQDARERRQALAACIAGWWSGADIETLTRVDDDGFHGWVMGPRRDVRGGSFILSVEESEPFSVGLAEAEQEAPTLEEAAPGDVTGPPMETERSDDTGPPMKRHR